MPIAAHARISGDELDLVGFIAAVDGSRSIKGKIVGHVDQAEQLGILLAESLLTQGGQRDAGRSLPEGTQCVRELFIWSGPAPVIPH